MNGANLTVSGMKTRQQRCTQPEEPDLLGRPSTGGEVKEITGPSRRFRRQLIAPIKQPAGLPTEQQGRQTKERQQQQQRVDAPQEQCGRENADGSRTEVDQRGNDLAKLPGAVE